MKDETLQYCVDYRRVNTIKVRDLYPIIWLDASIKSLEDAVVFFKADENSRYWQVELKYNDRSKTAFAFNHGL